MLERIKNIQGRFTEIESSLSSPEISKHLDKMEALGREHASLRPIIDLGKRYEVTLNDLNDAEHMLKEDDQEVVVFAQPNIAPSIGIHCARSNPLETQGEPTCFSRTPSLSGLCTAWRLRTQGGSSKLNNI